MADEQRALFLEQKRYRRQRLRDVAKVLPIVGVILLCMPLFWQGEAPTSNAWAVQYVFGVWVMLIVLTLVVARKLTAADKDVPN